MIRKLFAYYWDNQKKKIDKLERYCEGSFQKVHGRWLQRSAMAEKHNSVLRNAFKRHHKEDK